MRVDSRPASVPSLLATSLLPPGTLGPLLPHPPQQCAQLFPAPGMWDRWQVNQQTGWVLWPHGNVGVKPLTEGSQAARTVPVFSFRQGRRVLLMWVRILLGSGAEPLLWARQPPPQAPFPLGQELGTSLLGQYQFGFYRKPIGEWTDGIPSNWTDLGDPAPFWEPAHGRAFPCVHLADLPCHSASGRHHRCMSCVSWDIGTHSFIA